MPRFNVLLRGITYGLRPVVVTVALWVLVNLTYGAAGYICFSKNDSYHFGTLGLSMWTFFEIHSLNNWSDVTYVNMYGCDSYPTEYLIQNSTSYASTYNFTWDSSNFIVAQGSDFYLPVCYAPQSQPLLSPIVFVSYVVLVTFMVVNLTIAAVTSGIRERLEKLKVEMLSKEVAVETVSARCAESEAGRACGEHSAKISD